MKNFPDRKFEKKMKQLSLLILLTVILSSCAQRSENQPLLDRVYALVNDGEYKMAQDFFDNHKSEIRLPMSKADSMYCGFLEEFFDLYNSEADLFVINSFADTVRIGNIIDFYTQNSDNEKLAYSLLLKSLKLFVSLRHNDGIYYLKHAENIIKTLDNSELKYMLASVNLTYRTNNLDFKEGMPLLDTVAKYAHNQREKDGPPAERESPR